MVKKIEQFGVEEKGPLGITRKAFKEREIKHELPAEIKAKVDKLEPIDWDLASQSLNFVEFKELRKKYGLE